MPPQIATETKIVRDEAMGLNRKVVAGTQIPPDLADVYDGGTEEASPFPGRVVAEKTLTVFDENLKINRLIVKGTPVPPDLLAAYAKQTGDKDAKSAAEDAEKITDVPAPRHTRRAKEESA